MGATDGTRAPSAQPPCEIPRWTSHKNLPSMQGSREKTTSTSNWITRRCSASKKLSIINRYTSSDASILIRWSISSSWSARCILHQFFLPYFTRFYRIWLRLNFDQTDGKDIAYTSKCYRVANRAGPLFQRQPADEWKINVNNMIQLVWTIRHKPPDSAAHAKETGLTCNGRCQWHNGTYTSYIFKSGGSLFMWAIRELANGALATVGSLINWLTGRPFSFRWITYWLSILGFSQLNWFRSGIRIFHKVFAQIMLSWLCSLIQTGTNLLAGNRSCQSFVWWRSKLRSIISKSTDKGTCYLIIRAHSIPLLSGGGYGYVGLHSNLNLIKFKIHSKSTFLLCFLRVS